MISRRIHLMICVCLAVASSPVSTTGSEPEVTIPVLEFSDLETPAAAVFLALRQAALTYVQATQGWADAVRPLLLADPPAGKGTPASTDSRTSPAPSPGHGQTAAPAAPTTTTASPDAAAVSRYRSLSQKEKGERLIKAAKEGAVGELEALLAAGAEVAATDGSMWTALHWAAITGHVEVARRLLARGATVDARSSAQQTPLHYAANWGRAAVAQLLLAASAHHSARDKDWWTPLHFAASNGYTEVAAALLEAGADRAAKTNKGETPLDVARSYNKQQMVDLLTAT